MDKKLLSDYIDACELIRETEQHFKIEGTTFSMRDDARLLEKKKLLADRRAAAEETRVQVERWMVTIPARMQRIIRWKLFEGLTWEETAAKLGRKATGDSVRMEFTNFMK